MYSNRKTQCAIIGTATAYWLRLSAKTITRPRILDRPKYFNAVCDCLLIQTIPNLRPTTSSRYRKNLDGCLLSYERSQQCPPALPAVPRSHERHSPTKRPLSSPSSRP